MYSRIPELPPAVLMSEDLGYDKINDDPKGPDLVHTERSAFMCP